MKRSRSAFALTPVQEQANRLLGGEARHIFLRGGSRSGKTFILIRALVVRALCVPQSRHGVFRHRQVALRASIIQDTFPKVMRCCFAHIRYKWDGQSNRVIFPNGSSILFGGLDDSTRTEKILGLEFATIYLNEASQISYGARNMLLTRLAQRCALTAREYIDANPPTTDHWLYALFESGIEPRSGLCHGTPTLYASMVMNPDQNRANLSDAYLQQLEALPERERRRFLLGEYQTVIEDALWRVDMFRRCQACAEQDREALIGQMRRIVVAVDPSGASGPSDLKADEIGIVVAGVDHDGGGHVLEDCSLRGTYGDGGILPLYRMLCRFSAIMPDGLMIGEQVLRDLDPAGLSLHWPAWFAADEAELLPMAKGLGEAVNAGLLSQETAARLYACAAGVADPAAEWTKITAVRAA